MTQVLEPNPSQFLEPNPREGGLTLGDDRMAAITEYLCKGKQHVCHTNPKHACRGGRGIQLRVLAALGMIDDSTDEALRAANQEFLRSQTHP